MAGWLRVLLLLGCLLAATRSQALEISSARVTYTEDGVTRTVEAPLPYPWDRLHANRSGAAELELSFHLDADTTGLLPHLQELESRGAIELLKVKRTFFGSLYMEGYVCMVWRPKRSAGVESRS